MTGTDRRDPKAVRPVRSAVNRAPAPAAGSLRAHLDIEDPGRALVSWLVALGACIAVTSAVGAFVTGPLDETWVGRFDRRVVDQLFDARTASVDRLAGWGTLPADPIPVAVLWVGAMLVAYVVVRRLDAPLLILFAVGGEKLSYFITTLIVRRPRPEVPTIGAQHSTSSFPSGHVGSAVSLYGAIAVLIVAHAAHRSVTAKVLATMFVVVVAIDVAYFRMYSGFHYPTDVVAGVLLGATWVLVASRLAPPAR